MAKLDDLLGLVAEYQSNFRHPNMEPFKYIDKFDLKVNSPICPRDAAKKGVYAFFAGDELIYIGKSSAQKKAIWHRIVDYVIALKKALGARRQIILSRGLYQTYLF